MSGGGPFVVEKSGERIEGRAPGVNRAQLRRLRAGKLEVDAEVDLHGETARDAERALRDALVEAHEEGMRCVLVVHGRGVGSDGRPVLKEALPGWLGRPPLDAIVMAFASATQQDGGSGATYVLLRRRR